MLGSPEMTEDVCSNSSHKGTHQKLVPVQLPRQVSFMPLVSGSGKEELGYSSRGKFFHCRTFTYLEVDSVCAAGVPRCVCRTGGALPCDWMVGPSTSQLWLCPHGSPTAEDAKRTCLHAELSAFTHFSARAAICCTPQPLPSFSILLAACREESGILFIAES